METYRWMVNTMKKTHKPDAAKRRPFVFLYLRVPPELHAQLVKIAEAEDRSVTNLAVLLLKRAVGEGR